MPAASRPRSAGTGPATVCRDGKRCVGQIEELAAIFVAKADEPQPAWSRNSKRRTGRGSATGDCLFCQPTVHLTLVYSLLQLLLDAMLDRHEWHAKVFVSLYAISQGVDISTLGAGWTCAVTCAPSAQRRAGQDVIRASGPTPHTRAVTSCRCGWPPSQSERLPEAGSAATRSVAALAGTVTFATRDHTETSGLISRARARPYVPRGAQPVTTWYSTSRRGQACFPRMEPQHA